MLPVWVRWASYPLLPVSQLPVLWDQWLLATHSSDPLLPDHPSPDQLCPPDQSRSAPAPGLSCLPRPVWWSWQLPSRPWSRVRAVLWGTRRLVVTTQLLEMMTSMMWLPWEVSTWLRRQTWVKYVKYFSYSHSQLLQSILGATDHVGSIIRSCKDESFLQTGLLTQRIARICRDKGLESPSPDVINLVSHAAQERLKTLVSKLSVISEHRLDVIKTEGKTEHCWGQHNLTLLCSGPYVVTQDIKQQLRFLEDLDKIEKKKHDEEEKELLLRAAKSRTKSDDPEKEKLKAKAKEIQSLEAERIR